MFPISLTLGHMLLIHSTYSGPIFRFMLPPPFLYHSESSEKSTRRQSNRSSCCAPLAYPTVVAIPCLYTLHPPLLLPRKKDTLHLPSNPGLLHPLHRTIKLLLCHLSGNTSQATGPFNDSFRHYPASLEPGNTKAVKVILTTMGTLLS